MKRVTEIGSKWKQIERELRAKHSGAVVGRTSEQAVASMRKRFAWLISNKDRIVKLAEDYPGADSDTSEEEWDNRERLRVSTE